MFFSVNCQTNVQDAVKTMIKKIENTLQRGRSRFTHRANGLTYIAPNVGLMLRRIWKMKQGDCSMSKEAVNHPQHYNAGKIEVIDAIEDWKLGFHLGNVVKYVARAEHKNDALEDLKKARWYLDRYIKFIEATKDDKTKTK